MYVVLFSILTCGQILCITKINQQGGFKESPLQESEQSSHGLTIDSSDIEMEQSESDIYTYTYEYEYVEEIIYYDFEEEGLSVRDESHSESEANIQQFFEENVEYPEDEDNIHFEEELDKVDAHPPQMDAPEFGEGDPVETSEEGYSWLKKVIDVLDNENFEDDQLKSKRRRSRKKRVKRKQWRTRKVIGD